MVANTHEMPNQRSVKCPHSPTKHPRNTPPGVGDRFIAPVSLHHRICVSTLPNIHIRFAKSLHSFHRTRISPLYFVSVYVYAGAINRSLQLRTDCNNAADDLQQRCEQIAIYTRTPTKHHTFAPQKPYFRTTKTILLRCKIIIKMYLIENKEVTLLVKLNR